MYWQRFEAADYVNYTPQLLATLQRHISIQEANILEVGAALVAMPVNWRLGAQ
ncbi:MAG: hypothetical protein R3C44_00295 [Chloroflexota bacterium]